MRKRNNPSCAVRLDNTTRISELEYLRRQVHYFLPGLCPEPMLLTGNKPLDYCIYACVTLVHDPLELWSKNPSFYFKNILGRLVLIGTHFPVFFALFRLPYSGISQKIGHTGIANTKKWLDQAVFPCWSNYHTLAGE